MNLFSLLKRLLKTVFRVGVWASTAAVLFACLLFTRIFVAPLDLTFAKELVLDQAEKFLPGWEVSYEAAQVGWDWGSVRPWVAIDNIQLVDRRDRLQAAIPYARVDASFENLFGSAGISSIRLVSPIVNVSDLAGFSDATDKGSFDWDFDWDGPLRPEVFKPVTEGFSRFALRLLTNAPSLEIVSVENAYVNIARGPNLSKLELTLPNIGLRHDDGELHVLAEVDALFADQLTHVRLSGQAHPANGELSVNLGFTELSLAAITRGIELPEALTYLNVPLGLDLSLDLTSKAGLRSAAFALSIGEGYLYHPVAYPKKSPISYGSVSGVLNVADQRLVLDEIDLLLGDRQVTGSGEVFWAEGSQHTNKHPGVKLSLSLAEVSVDDVKKYWPIRLFPDGRPRGARDWIDRNMTGGFAEDVKLELTLNPDGTTPYLNGSLFEITFDVRDVDTSYVKTMAPLENVAGRAVLTNTAFDVFISSGTVAGMPVGGSVAQLSNINIKGKGYGVFDVALDGGVREILALVETKPVDIGKRIKIDLDRLSGNAKVVAKISLPLLKRPPIDEVLYEVKAFLKNAALDDLLGGEGLRAADVSFELNKDELIASGFGDLNGVPMELYWHENFLKGRNYPDADTSLLVMSGLADEYDMQALGIDVSSYLAGKARTEVTFLGRNLKFRTGYFSADTTDAELMVTPIGWRKEPSVPASVTGIIHLLEQGTRLSPLVVKGENIDLRASFDFGVDGKGTFSGTVDAVELGKNIAKARIIQEEGLPLNIFVSADVFDMAPLLARSYNGATDNDETGAGYTAAGNNNADTEIDVDLILDAKSLHLLNGEQLSNVDVMLEFAGGVPSVLAVTSEDTEGITSVEIKPIHENKNDLTAAERTTATRSLILEGPDGGKILRGLGFFAHFQGGDIHLDAETSGWGNNFELAGVLKIRDTKLVAQSSLGEGITEGVITGLDEYLEDGSVTLDIVDVPFSYSESLLDISSLKANGPSVGMAMEGQIQTRDGIINVNGVVVPAYGLNSLLGKIPIVGNLFSGGSGKGLFGLTYRVKGSTTRPKVSVNPLSGLAPGFLRLLFEGRKGKVSDVIVPDVPAADASPELDGNRTNTGKVSSPGDKTPG
ncbi:MAG: hypothetical protein JKY34_00100 [Kordiimonadaceae bacterium]|nr:hypothetical protein [Kordiimonadaceae bacterium]